MEKTEKSNLFNKDEKCGLQSKMGTRPHCDECNKIVRMTMKCYCDMDICQKCYLENLKHKHWNILHRLASIQIKCRIIPPLSGALIPDNVYNIITVNSCRRSAYFSSFPHDEVSKYALYHILRELELEPIILDTEANAGKTIFKKLEEHTASVGYAFVLLTPDDMGGIK